MDTAEHVAGTLMFLGGGAVYFWLMIAIHPGRWSWWFSSGLYCITGVLILGFLGTHFLSASDAGVTLEWVAFMTQSVSFSAFFAVHSFRAFEAPRPSAVELSPLIATPVWRGRGEAEVESGLI